MALKRISDKTIARTLEKVKMFKGYDLTDAVCDNDRVVAQAQLEACEKEFDEHTKFCQSVIDEVKFALDNTKKAHKAELGEIKEELEHFVDYVGDTGGIMLFNSGDWQEFWRKYGGE